MFAQRMVTALVGMLLVTPAAFAAPVGATKGRPAGVNARQHQQAQRIRGGVKGGEITSAEADKLKADEAGVRAEERVYRASGDGLNKREKQDLEKDLNKTSREIYRAKHNSAQAGGSQ